MRATIRQVSINDFKSSMAEYTLSVDTGTGAETYGWVAFIAALIFSAFVLGGIRFS